jgi:hypothetical protein
MKLKQVLIVLLINLHCLLPLHIVAQSVMYLADSAENISASYPIIAEDLFERAIYFNQNDSIEFVLHNKIASLLIQQNKIQDAAWHYKKAAYINPIPQAILMQSWSCLWNNQPIEAINSLDTNIFWDEFDTIQRVEATLILGLSFEKIENIDLAIAYYNRLIPLLDANYINELNSINQQISKLKHKKTVLAGLLSAMVPGLGQLYAGYPKEALNSFALNGLLISGLVITSINYTWFDGVLAFGTWLPRYYIGGIKLAAKLAKQRNLDKKNLLFQKRVNLIKKGLLIR